MITIAEGGDFVLVKAAEGEWAKVEYDGVVGWAHARFLGPARDRGAVSTRGRRPGAVVTESAVRLPVPYRTQLDGSAYQSANCGPASIGMVLQAFGKYMPTTDLRRAANRMQGTAGWYDSGVALEVLTEIVSEHGLVPRGLFVPGGASRRGYVRWSMDDVRQALRNGDVMVPQVHLATLPGQEHSHRGVDHFIVIIGYDEDRFIYHDPAFNGGGGHSLWITEERLSLAWKRGDYPFAGFSVGPGEGIEPLVEPLAPPVQVAAAAPPPAAPAPSLPDREMAREQLRRYFEAEPPTTVVTPAQPLEVAAVAVEPTVAVAPVEASVPTVSVEMPRVLAPDPGWPAMLAAVLGLALLGSRRVLSVREVAAR